MFVGNLLDVEKIAMNVPGAKGAFKQAAIGPKEGWEDYVLRVMTLEVSGNTPKHSHPWPHINYVLKGEGIIIINNKEYPAKEGVLAYIPSNDEHGFVNTSATEEMQFICIVPKEGDK